MLICKSKVLFIKKLHLILIKTNGKFLKIKTQIHNATFILISME